MPAHDIRWTAIFSFVLASHGDLPSLSHVRDWTAMDCNRKSWTLPFAISSTFSCTSAWKCLPNKQVPSKSQAVSLYILYAHSQFTIQNLYATKQRDPARVVRGFVLRPKLCRDTSRIPGGWRFGGLFGKFADSKVKVCRPKVGTHILIFSLQLSCKILKNWEIGPNKTEMQHDTTSIRATAVAKYFGSAGKTKCKGNEKEKSKHAWKHTSKRSLEVSVSNNCAWAGELLFLGNETMKLMELMKLRFTHYSLIVEEF